MELRNESRLARWYRRTYEALCGKHPRPRPWHFQYLDAFYLYRSLKRVLPEKAVGMVLDIGCGDAPYRTWCLKAERYIGIDTKPGEGVNYVVGGREKWPIPDASVDTLICTQVLEHAEDLEHVLSEMDRVLRPGGGMIVSFPFIYNEHGAPYDFRRFSAHGAANLFQGYTVESLEKQGGIGSTLAILWLNWIEAAMNGRFTTRLLKGPLLPLWILVSLVSNVLGLLVDRLDITNAFYSNVLVVVVRID